jgi:hypothetical protein
MIDDGPNPMAEVALALAMAFFSLMVLTLFAVVHQPNDAVAEKITLTSSSTNAQSERPKLIILHKQRLFDDMLNPIDTADLITEQPITLAVHPGITMAEMMQFQQSHSGLNLKITELTDEWETILNARLEN